MKLPWLASIFAFLAGALVTVQAGSNAQLKQGFGTPMPALLVNYVLGLGACKVVGWSRQASNYVISSLPFHGRGTHSITPAPHNFACSLMCSGAAAATW